MSKTVQIGRLCRFNTLIIQSGSSGGSYMAARFGYRRSQGTLSVFLISNMIVQIARLSRPVISVAHFKSVFVVVAVGRGVREATGQTGVCQTFAGVAIGSMHARFSLALSSAAAVPHAGRLGGPHLPQARPATSTGEELRKLHSLICATRDA